MKKIMENTTLYDETNNTNKNLEKNKYKTTNVNILLNRVRLDKKKILRKKIIFLSFLITACCALTIYTII